MTPLEAAIARLRELAVILTPDEEIGGLFEDSAFKDEVGKAAEANISGIIGSGSRPEDHVDVMASEIANDVMSMLAGQISAADIELILSALAKSSPGIPIHPTSLDTNGIKGLAITPDASGVFDGE